MRRQPFLNAKRAAIVESHMKMASSMASGFAKRNGMIAELDDLQSVAFEGLVEAALRFEEGKAVPFGVYARWWVRNRISMYVRQHRWAMRIPDHVYKLLLKTLKSIRLLTQSLRREPTAGEIARRMDISVKQLHQILAWLGAETVSLNMPVGENGKSNLGDFISEDRRLWKATTRRWDEGPEFEELRRSVSGMLRSLTKEEQYVLTHRFGLKRAVSKTVRAIANRAHLEPAMVLKTEQRALRKLRRLPDCAESRISNALGGRRSWDRLKLT